MAEYPYEYSIQNDLPGNVSRSNISTAWFQFQVEKNSNFTSTIDRVDTRGDNLYIIFQEELSAEEKLILDGDTSDPAGGMVAVSSNWIPEGTSYESSQGYIYKERTDEQSTSSTSWTDFLTLDATFFSGFYRFGISYLWRFSSPSSDIETRLCLQKESDGAEIIFHHKQEPKDGSGDQRNPGYLFRGIEIEDGNYSVSFQFRSSRSGRFATLFYAALEVEKR